LPETRFVLHLARAGVDCEAFFAGYDGGVVEFGPFTQFGFSGEHSNRTLARRYVGAVGRVPWA